MSSRASRRLLTDGLPSLCCTDTIDPKTQEIKPASSEVYSDLREVADELPDSSPRFILLSYPLTLVSPPLPNPFPFLPVSNHPILTPPLSEPSGLISIPIALRPHLRPLRATLLSPRELQATVENELCRGRGGDAGAGGSGKGAGDQ